MLVAGEGEKERVREWIEFIVLSVNGLPAPMANEQRARCRHTLGRYRTGGVRPSLRDETFLSTVFSLSIDVVTTVFSLPSPAPALGVLQVLDARARTLRTT